MDPERAHALALRVGAVVKAPGLLFQLIRAISRVGPAQNIRVGALTFQNALGLAAGCDKNCEALDLFAALGFGHIEVGTVTSEPQEGNPKPRMFRLAEDRALINRLGFPSHGAVVVADRLRAARARLNRIDGTRPIIGVNIGKLKSVPIDHAEADYIVTAKHFTDLADYIAINVSSPNTPDLRALQERGRLSGLLRGVVEATDRKVPIFVKIAPDLSWEQISDVIGCAIESGIAGIIATNTTIDRSKLSVDCAESGGLSGAALRERSLEVVQFIGRECASELASERLGLIGVGGISSPADAQRMLDAGAQAVQLYTGLVYRGPFLCSQIINNLAKKSQS